MIVLKMVPDPTRVQAVHEVLKQLMEKEERFQGTLFIIDTHKYRARRKP